MQDHKARHHVRKDPTGPVVTQTEWKGVVIDLYDFSMEDEGFANLY